MDLCNFQFDMFSFGKLETCETHLAKTLYTVDCRKKSKSKKDLPDLSSSTDFIGLF